jgi:uncharacterized membrane protein
MRHSVIYMSTLLIFVAIDIMWLGFVARDFYRSQLGDLVAPQLNIGAAVAFYLIYIVGITVFAVRPALRSGSWRDAYTLGALLGLVAYSTYDLSNLATLRNWPALLALVDVLWGTALSAIAAAGGYGVGRWSSKSL